MALNQRKKNILIGAVVLTSFLILVWGFNYLKGKNFLTNYHEYHVHYENTNGLSESAFVTLHGYRVGYVKKIKLEMQNEAKISVLITVDKKIKLPVGTVARITSMDIMGTKVVELVVTESSIYHKNGDLLNSDSEEGLKDQISVQLQPLKMKIEDLIFGIGEALQTIQIMLDPQTQHNLKNALASLNVTLTNLGSITGTIDNIASGNEIKLNLAVKNFTNFVNNDLQSISNNLTILTKTLSDSISYETIGNLNNTILTLNNIVTKIENGEGTLGKLSASDTLHNALQVLVKDLDELAIDIKENPKRYINVSVFGGKEKKK